MNFELFLIEKFGEHNPKEIDELILDDLLPDQGELTLEQKQVLEKYKNLIRLSMCGLSLKSLTNFPTLPNLHVLDISQNILTGNDFEKIPTLYPHLHKLNISLNNIENIECIEKLKNSSIEKLEVFENPFLTKSKKAIDKLFLVLKHVTAINKKTSSGVDVYSTDYNEESEEEEEFQGDSDEEYEGDNNLNSDDDDEDEYD
jgi:hypothetical protein